MSVIPNQKHPITTYVLDPVMPHSGPGTGSSIAANAIPTTSSARTWVANLVQYNPVWVNEDFPVERVYWVNGSTVTSTNVDFGIYTVDGTRIYNTGSTAMSGSSTRQYVTPSTLLTLSPGLYYFAWTCDNTTNRAHAQGGNALSGALYGLLEETTGAFGLPATMTPVTFARAWGVNACGVTRVGSGL
jgi:hypothetical protein